MIVRERLAAQFGDCRQPPPVGEEDQEGRRLADPRHVRDQARRFRARDFGVLDHHDIALLQIALRGRRQRAGADQTNQPRIQRFCGITAEDAMFDDCLDVIETRPGRIDRHRLAETVLQQRFEALGEGQRSLRELVLVLDGRPAVGGDKGIMANAIDQRLESSGGRAAKTRRLFLRSRSRPAIGRGLRATMPPDAFTAETLGTERAGHGVMIRESGLILTIGYLITEADQIWLHLADGRAVAGTCARLRSGDRFRSRPGAGAGRSAGSAAREFRSVEGRRQRWSSAAPAAASARSPRAWSASRNSPAIGNTCWTRRSSPRHRIPIGAARR